MLPLFGRHGQVLNDVPLKEDQGKIHRQINCYIDFGPIDPFSIGTKCVYTFKDFI